MTSDEQKDQNLPDDDQLERAFEYYPRLRKVKEYVDEHLGDPISLEDAARVAMLEPKYFSSLFKRRLGIGFKRWLLEQRIARAKNLIEAQEVDITSVAYSVGFSSLRSFQRSFLEQTGVTPSQYRRSRQG